MNLPIAKLIYTNDLHKIKQCWEDFDPYDCISSETDEASENEYLVNLIFNSDSAYDVIEDLTSKIEECDTIHDVDWVNEAQDVVNFLYTIINLTNNGWKWKEQVPSAKQFALEVMNNTPDSIQPIAVLEEPVNE